MTKDEALKLALEALEYRALGITSGGKDLDDRAITAIKQALALDKKAEEHMIYKTFEQWRSGNVLEHGVPRTEHYSEDQFDLVEMGWNYGYDAGRAVEQALDKKAENARELGLDYEPHKGLSEHLAQTTNGRVRIDPVTGDVGIGTAPAQPALVQEPFCFFYVENGEEYFAPKGAYVPDNAQPLYTTPPAHPAPVQEPIAFFDPQEKGFYWAKPMRIIAPITVAVEPMPLYTTPPAAQPAVPDAFGTREGEHPQYIQGWNDCRAEMLRGKP